MSPTGTASRPAPLLAVAGALVAFSPGCGPEQEPDAPWIIERAIEAHGGDAFRAVGIEFLFRGDTFLVSRRDGRFRYERLLHPAGTPVREVMTNDSTWRVVGGSPVPLAAEERRGVESAINSVVYFGFLPFRLDDPAVRARSLGVDTIRGEPYRAVEVTFQREGGGPDWEDRFVHWFHEREHTLDYFAYRYHRGEGGTRFREAFNRREKGGVVLQDYRNLRLPGIRSIEEYPRYLERDELEHVSDVELQAVRIGPAPDDLPG